MSDVSHQLQFLIWKWQLLDWFDCDLSRDYYVLWRLEFIKLSTGLHLTQDHNHGHYVIVLVRVIRMINGLTGDKLLLWILILEIECIESNLRNWKSCQATDVTLCVL